VAFELQRREREEKEEEEENSVGTEVFKDENGEMEATRFHSITQQRDGSPGGYSVAEIAPARGAG